MTISTIVLTGGPGGGKTTSLECLTKRLESLGFKVFTVPEIATFLFKAGVQLKGIEPQNLKILQLEMIKCQLAIEDSIRTIAKNYPKSVILHDRGVIDPAAFISRDVWLEILEEGEYRESALKNRYDAVIHLSSAANGAEEHYTTANNNARSETVSQAKEADLRIQKAWLGHPHLRIIESCSDFPKKINNALHAISRVLGIPEPVEIERKFLVKSIPDIFPVDYIDSLIEQSYLTDTSRIRSRDFGEYILYTHTYKRDISDKERHEEETKISRSRYEALLSRVDKERTSIRKIRRCFLWDKQYFELDLYIHPREGLKLLEIELEVSDQDVRLPSFIDIDREVTDEKNYANYNLAKRQTGEALLDAILELPFPSPPNFTSEEDSLLKKLGDKNA